jgi:hypothetical protein
VFHPLGNTVLWEKYMGEIREGDKGMKGIKKRKKRG